MGAITDSDPYKIELPQSSQTNFIKLETKADVEKFDLQQDMEILDLEVVVKNPQIVLKPRHTFEDNLEIDLGVIKIHAEQYKQKGRWNHSKDTELNVTAFVIHGTEGSIRYNYQKLLNLQDFNV